MASIGMSALAAKEASWSFPRLSQRQNACSLLIGGGTSRTVSCRGIRSIAAAAASILAGDGRSEEPSSVVSAPKTASVPVEVQFQWKGKGRDVQLTGSFLDWGTKLLLQKGPDGVFTMRYKLAPGSHTYKFIVDGEWRHSADHPTVEDGTGGFNNQIVVSTFSAASSASKAVAAASSGQPARASGPASAAAGAAKEAAGAAGGAGGPNGKKPAEKAAPKEMKAAMEEDFIPLLEKTLGEEKDLLDLKLAFADLQLTGSFIKAGIPYAFWAFFPDGKFEGARGFSLASHGNPPSTVEPFLIDERKITPDLFVFWVKKRLFAQKVLSLN